MSTSTSETESVNVNEAKHIMIEEVGPQGRNELSAIVEARWQHIRDMARCTSCGATKLVCDRERGTAPDAPDWMGCCVVGLDFRPCHHVQDPLAVATLFREIVAGTVRTVDEVDPMPFIGPPRRPSWDWLLHQAVWWAPQRGPMLKVHRMTDTHRLHSVRMLERNARRLAWNEHMILLGYASGPFGPSGDMAVDAFERELDELLHHPVEWLHGCELYRSLSAGLPTVDPNAKQKLRKRQEQARADLEARAAHWSTCPSNRDLRQLCKCRVEHPDDPEVGPPVDRGLFDEASGQGVL